MESLTNLCALIQSNFHHVIIKVTSESEIENVQSQLPNLVDYFEALIKTLKEKPHITTVGFGEQEENDSSYICISNLEGYFGIDGMYGGFTIEFKKEQDKQQITLIKPESPCHCNACLSMKNYQFSGSSHIDLEEFKNWSLLTDSWCRVVEGSEESHRVNSNGYIHVVP